LRGLILENPVRELWGPLAALALLGGLAGLYLGGVMGEVATALVLASLFGVVVFGLPFLLAEEVLATGLERALFGVAALGSALVFAALVGAQLFPGKPVADLVFRGEERTARFELEGDGRLALVAHRGAGHGPARVQYELLLKRGEARARVKGEFGEASLKGRGGGGVTSRQGAESHRVALGGGGAVEVVLVGYTGNSAPLYLDVYQARVPAWLPWLVQVLALAAALVLRWRLGRTTTRVLVVNLALAGLVLALGLPGALPPSEPVKPLFGWILLALLAGGLGGEFLNWLVLKLSEARH
jgi:hypothetical protein